jgi:hypothetical protein
VDESGVYPVDIIPPWSSILIYYLGMNNKPAGGSIPETQSDAIDIIIILPYK